MASWHFFFWKENQTFYPLWHGYFCCSTDPQPQQKIIQTNSEKSWNKGTFSWKKRLKKHPKKISFEISFDILDQHSTFFIRRSQGKMNLVLPLHRHPGLLSQMLVAYIPSVMSPSAVLPNETTKRVGKRMLSHILAWESWLLCRYYFCRSLKFPWNLVLRW